MSWSERSPLADDDHDARRSRPNSCFNTIMRRRAGFCGFCGFCHAEDKMASSLRCVMFRHSERGPIGVVGVRSKGVPNSS